MASTAGDGQGDEAVNMYIVVIGPLVVEFWILPSLALCLWSLGGDGLRGCMAARGSVVTVCGTPKGGAGCD
jgi:hypothetical protein